MLLKSVADLASRRCELLWLDVLKSNVGAQRFYANHGFQVLGEIPFSTDLMQSGMFVMVRLLTADAWAESSA